MQIGTWMWMIAAPGLLCCCLFVCFLVGILRDFRQSKERLEDEISAAFGEQASLILLFQKQLFFFFFALTKRITEKIIKSSIFWTSIPAAHPSTTWMRFSGFRICFCTKPCVCYKVRKDQQLLACQRVSLLLSMWVTEHACRRLPIYVYWPAGLLLFLLGAQVLHADFLTTMLSRQWEEPVLV